MKKSIVITLDILAVLLISIISFTLFNVSIGVVLSYIFLIIAFLIQWIPFLISNNFNDVAYKTVPYTLSIMYLILQICISLLGYTVFVNSIKFIVISSLVVMILYIASIIISYSISTNGEKSNKLQSRKGFFIEKTIYQVERLKSTTKEKEIVTLLDEVSDVIRYSNLNSPTQAAEIETEILNEVLNLEKNISLSKLKECKNSCAKISALFSERNMLCKLYKES